MKHTPYGLCTLPLQVLWFPRWLNKEFSPKIKAHFLFIVLHTYWFHFIFVMNCVMTIRVTNFRCPAPTVHYLSPSNQKLQKMFAQEPNHDFKLYKNTALIKDAHFKNVLPFVISESKSKKHCQQSHLTSLHVCCCIIDCIKFWSIAIWGII